MRLSGRDGFATKESRRQGESGTVHWRPPKEVQESTRPTWRVGAGKGSYSFLIPFDPVCQRFAGRPLKNLWLGVVVAHLWLGVVVARTCEEEMKKRRRTNHMMLSGVRKG